MASLSKSRLGRWRQQLSSKRCQVRNLSQLYCSLESETNTLPSSTLTNLDIISNYLASLWMSRVSIRTLSFQLLYKEKIIRRRCSQKERDFVSTCLIMIVISTCYGPWPSHCSVKYSWVLDLVRIPSRPLQWLIRNQYLGCLSQRRADVHFQTTTLATETPMSILWKQY